MSGWVSTYLTDQRCGAHFDVVKSTKIEPIKSPLCQNKSEDEKTENIFWAFSSSSQIHGFSFIADSRKNRARCIFWVCFVLALFCLCANYTAVLVQVYLAQPTAIAIQTTSNLSNFVFPAAVACGQIDFPLYLEQILGNESVATFMATLQSFNDSGGLALLQSGNEEEVSAQLLNFNGSSLDDSIVAASYALLALAMDYDRGQPTSTTQISAYLHLVDILQEYFDNATIDYRFLAKVIGAYISQQMQMTFSLYETSTLSIGATLDSIVWLGAPGYVPNPHLVCSTFGNWTIMPSNIQAFVGVSAQPAMLYNFENCTTGACNLISSLKIYFDPRGGASTRDPSNFDALTPGGFGVGVYAGIEATGHYVWLNRSIMPCGDIDQFECAEQRLFDQIEASRKCRSLMQFGGAAGSPCRQRYTLAKAIAVDEGLAVKNWQSIYGACPRQCEYTRFSSQLVVQAGDGSGHTQLQQFAQPILFFTNVEYYLMDFPTFLNAFGGLIGWWVGGSLLAVVHIIIFISKSIAQTILSRARARSVLSLLARHQRLKVFETVVLKYMREFLAITTFHGFAFLSDEPNFIVVLLWLLIIPVSIGFATKQTVLLAAFWATDPSVTNIRVQVNATQSFDDAAICIEFFRASLFSTASIIDFRATLENFSSSGQMNILRDTLSVIDGDSLAALDQNVMLLSHMMVSAFADFDIFEPAVIPIAYVNQSVLDEMDLLHDALVNNSIDFFRLAKMNAAFICDIMFELKVFVYTYDIATSTFNTSIFNPCHNLDMFFWITDYPLYPCTSTDCPLEDYMCVKLPPSLTTFGTPQDYLSFRTFANPGQSLLFLLFDLRHGVGALDSTSYDGQFCTGPSSVAAGSISISSDSQQYNSSSSPCSPSPVLFDCATDCIFQSIVANRKCWSLGDLSLQLKPPGMPPCLEHYSFEEALILTNNGTVSPYANCSDQNCLPPCKSRVYNVVTLSISVSENSTVTQVDIHQGIFAYLVYEGSALMDVWAFLWAFGGTIGLWIGGSVIAIIHVPSFLLSAFSRHFASLIRKDV